MTTERFSLDTNVLVYAADGRGGAQHRRAVDILILAARRDSVLTPQALGELYHVTQRKRIAPGHDVAAQIGDLLKIFATAAADVQAFRMALAGAEQGKCSFWDGLLIATAARAGWAFVLSEDMQDGARLHGVTILNPFVGDDLPAPVPALLG